MIVLKYRKAEEMRFISHIDLLRHMSRIIRRACIPINYSLGFNPHALLFFSPPTVVGISSEAEYVAIDTALDGAEVLKRYNSSVRESLQASEYFWTAKNPNLQGKCVAADYILPIDYVEFDFKPFNVTYQKKKETVTQDVGDKIFGIFNANGQLGLNLAAGNNNLRVDRVANELSLRFGCEIDVCKIVKTAQYVGVDGKEINSDEYCRQLGLVSAI